MGQQFIIDNRPGAGGTLGSALVAQSKPDGYTLLIQTAASHVSNPHLYSKLPYDALRDFVGISPLARVVAVLTVHPSLPPRSVKEFIALAKSRPKQILHGHSGYGSFTHFNGVLFESRAGISMTHVPFKGGGPAVIALGVRGDAVPGRGDRRADRVHQVESRARAGRDFGGTGSAAPGCADDRGHHSGLRILDLGQRFCAGGDPQGHRRSVERRDRESNERP
jgi:tripartite-type tricarboxylate transporter receptor subunit TctC